MSQSLNFSLPGLRALFAPPTCELCNRLVEVVPSLCDNCAQGLTLLSGSRCTICDLPFSVTELSMHRCQACLQEAPSFSKVTSVFVFDEIFAKVLHSLKFGKRFSVLETLLQKALPSFQNTLETFAPDVLLPLPLGWWRRFRRGFNQSTMIALALQRVAVVKIPFLMGVRRRATAPQAQRRRAERLLAMRGVFSVSRPDLVKGRRILIIDDVMTTGATVEALSKTLLQAGAELVQVFTLARVPQKRGEW